jgi:hypothetical protein
MIRSLVHNELEGMWKESVVIYCPSIRFKELRMTTEIATQVSLCRGRVSKLAPLGTQIGDFVPNEEILNKLTASIYA